MYIPEPHELVDDAGSEYFVACREHHSINLKHSNPIFNNAVGESGVERYLSVIMTEDINDYQLAGSYCCNPAGGGSVIQYPFTLGSKTIDGYYPGGAHFVDTNSVVTPLQTFNNIIHIIEPKPYNYPYGRHYYFSKNVGLVKTIYQPDSTIWLLINYQIK